MKKKKPLTNQGLIPTAYFKSSAVHTPVDRIDASIEEKITTTATTEPIKEEVQIESEVENPLEEKAETPIAEETVEAVPSINIAPKSVSAYSLSSIRKKKEHLEELNSNTKEEEILPEDAFEEAKMQELWAQYVEEIEVEGQKILASNLNSDVPKLLKDHKIWIELPNDTMKKEVERSQSGVLNFLKKELNNYAISLKITVSEEVAKQFAFTPEEKYEKLREKNPNVDILRSKLDLDIS